MNKIVLKSFYTKRRTNEKGHNIKMNFRATVDHSMLDFVKLINPVYLVEDFILAFPI